MRDCYVPLGPGHPSEPRVGWERSGNDLRLNAVVGAGILLPGEKHLPSRSISLMLGETVTNKYEGADGVCVAWTPLEADRDTPP